MDTRITIDNGIDTETRLRITEGLSRLLADTYTLYLKTHNYHWNVTGPMFQTLHLTSIFRAGGVRGRWRVKVAER
jgi:DNA-binding ferritin-like protein